MSDQGFQLPLGGALTADERAFVVAKRVFEQTGKSVRIQCKDAEDGPLVLLASVGAVDADFVEWPVVQWSSGQAAVVIALEPPIDEAAHRYALSILQEVAAVLVVDCAVRTHIEQQVVEGLRTMAFSLVHDLRTPLLTFRTTHTSLNEYRSTPERVLNSPLWDSFGRDSDRAVALMDLLSLIVGGDAGAVQKDRRPFKEAIEIASTRLRPEIVSKKASLQWSGADLAAVTAVGSVPLHAVSVEILLGWLLRRIAPSSVLVVESSVGNGLLEMVFCSPADSAQQPVSAVEESVAKSILKMRKVSSRAVKTRGFGFELMAVGQVARALGGSFQVASNSGMDTCRLALRLA